MHHFRNRILLLSAGTGRMGNIKIINHKKCCSLLVLGVNYSWFQQLQVNIVGQQAYQHTKSRSPITHTGTHGFFNCKQS